MKKRENEYDFGWWLAIIILPTLLVWSWSRANYDKQPPSERKNTRILLTPPHFPR